MTITLTSKQLETARPEDREAIFDKLAKSAEELIAMSSDRNDQQFAMLVRQKFKPSTLGFFISLISTVKVDRAALPGKRLLLARLKTLIAENETINNGHV